MLVGLVRVRYVSLLEISEAWNFVKKETAVWEVLPPDPGSLYWNPKAVW